MEQSSQWLQDQTHFSKEIDATSHNHGRDHCPNDGKEQNGANVSKEVALKNKWSDIYKMRVTESDEGF